MNELTNRIPEVRRMIAMAELQGKYEAPIRPSKLYRMATNPTRKPYDFKRAKARRKMAKQSRRINRKR
jgi:hypothetical protein